MNLSAEETRKVVRETVHETLSGLGFDVREPGETQADMYYLRKIRRGSEDMARKVRASGITLIVSTGLYLLWQAVKGLLERGS